MGRWRRWDYVSREVDAGIRFKVTRHGYSYITRHFEHWNMPQLGRAELDKRILAYRVKHDYQEPVNIQSEVNV